MIESNISEVIKELSNYEKKQLPFAISTALNKTMYECSNSLTDELINTFDRPVLSYFKNTKGNSNIFEIAKANKENLQVSMQLREDGQSKGSKYNKVLEHHFKGGNRANKRFEAALQYGGIDYEVVMGKDVPKNAYGNLNGGFYNQLMSYFQLHYKAGYNGNMTLKKKQKIENKQRTKSKKHIGKGYEIIDGKKYVADGYVTYKGKRYFIANGTGRTKHLHPGIYSVKGIHSSDMDPILIFIKKGNTNYKQRIDFHSFVNDFFSKNLDKNFNEALKNAIDTAKK